MFGTRLTLASSYRPMSPSIFDQLIQWGFIMKQRHLILSASIAAALAVTPGILLATSENAALAGINTTEAPRVTQAVNSSHLFTIPKTHLDFVGKGKTTSSVALAGTTTMKHLQLVLKPSAARQTAMESLIANQHNPKSAQFQKWLTPEQFGKQFGVVDGDIAAVTSWLASQGFTVNNVYPNKTQIDFSGTAAQVNQAFHTQEAVYTIGTEKHLANASDISVPAALQLVVAGVMGLNDFRPTALVKKPEIAQWNAGKKGFVSKSKPASGSKVISQALNFNSTERGLVPNDLATMYGIRTIRANGVTGKGITIAVVEDNDMVRSDWTNFTSTFNLAQYGGTFQQINPAPTSGTSNCVDPSTNFLGEPNDDGETLLDAEWATAIAPGANIVVASCADDGPNYYPLTSNIFGGVFIAATNLINGTSRPDIISASYGLGELFTDSASKTAIDLMWAQADAEGISVFVSTGDSGSNPSFNGNIIQTQGVDANALGTSPHDTGVGGTDTADILDGTTSQYFAPTPSVVGGSALSYVPEIPWNESCANGVAATAFGFTSALSFCQEYLKLDPDGWNVTSEAGSGGPSSTDAKPVWQQQIFNAAKDHSRDLPDVALFAASYGGYTWVITCTNANPCTPGFTTPMALSGGTSLASPMFAGIQALIDQGLAARGLSQDQGNAAPTLYALAADEYGGATGPTPASLAVCNANNGATGTANCVFHNVTRGSISTQCIEIFGETTPDCYFYGQSNSYLALLGVAQLGMTTSNASPTSYGVSNKAYGAQPGWSFASGLGSVNATNLLIAWRAFDHAPPAP